MNYKREYLKDNFIRFIIEGKREITTEEIEVRKKKFNLEWLSGQFVVAMISPDFSMVKYHEKDEILGKYEEYTRNILIKKHKNSYCLINGYNNIVVLMAFNDNITISNELDMIFINIRQELVRKFGYEVFIGVGSIAGTVQQISTSASDAQEMLAYKYQYADSGVVNIMNMVQFQCNISGGNGIEFDRVIGCFQDGNLGKMELRLNELVESIRKRPGVSKTSIKRSLVELSVHILHLASNANIDVDSVLNDKDPYRWIMKQNRTEIITEWIMKLSSELIVLIQNKKQTKERTVIQQAKQYIDDNLACAELSLQQVSERVGLSTAYCSQLFKKEVGMGISSYITQKRIGRAKIMLADTPLMSAEISKQLGFTSAGYFGQVFRKNVGVTPNEYRRINSKIKQ